MNENSSKGELNEGFALDEEVESRITDITRTYKTEEFRISTEENAEHREHSRTELKQLTFKCLKHSVHLVVVGYFSYATYHYLDVETNYCDDANNNNKSAFNGGGDGNQTNHPLCGMQFCSGYGYLILLLSFSYLALFYNLVFKAAIGHRLYRSILRPLQAKYSHLTKQRSVCVLKWLLILVCLVAFLYFETRKAPSKLVALLAPCIFILGGYTFSSQRKAIKWRQITTGIAVQFLLGIVCIRWSVGRNIFHCIGNKVAAFLGYADAGSRFVFGDTIVNEGVFAFTALPVIFFFSFIISVLYYLSVMQIVIMKLGWILRKLLDTTVCESVNAAGNIFLGMSECPLVIRPYIDQLTASEIHSIMVSGFATVSGSVLAAYLKFGASPAHLITASVMAAPASLALSKLYMPETEESKTKSSNIKLAKSEDTSILDAAANGASNAVPIVMGIIANLVAFLGFITFLNVVVSWLGFLVGLDQIDFEWIFSKLFIPLAWIMGVPWKDCDIVAKVVATKTIINEFVAYERLGEYIRNEAIDQARSAGIATFAICGFANPSSMGILIGSLSAMAPKRRPVIAAVAFRAFVVGSIVCFMSASFAGIFMDEEQAL
uniref:Sodium/nucleoside cotransporter n=1 Tax=Glossina brevipalpis TaxID=37001 RepID=A0A1A9WK06_9MUSC